MELLGGGGSRMLRIYIDKPDGVTHADCELISQQVGNILDAEDVIPGGRYTLEVSSPGVERKLTQARGLSSDSPDRRRNRAARAVEDQKHWEGTMRGSPTEMRHAGAV